MIDNYLHQQKQICQRIEQELRNENPTLNKFLPLEMLLEKTMERGDRILVVSSGTFGLPHYGHTDYLQRASQLGDIHVVCNNTDASIQRLGQEPFIPEHGRVIEFTGKESVDYFTFFDEDDPTKILDYLKPGIYTKGKDWKNKDLPEREIIESNGGKIVFIDFVYDISSGKIISKINSKAK